MYASYLFFVTAGVLWCALSAGAQVASTPPLTADAIMARVAANQDRAQAERSRYVYVQHAKMVSKKGKKVMCEEITDYRVTPSGKDSHFQLIKLDGKAWHKGKYIPYDHLAPNNIEGDQVDKPADSKQAADGAAKPAPGPPSQKPDKSGGNKPTDDASALDSDGGVDRDIVENIRGGLLHDKSKDGIDSGLFPLTSKAQADYVFRLIGRERMNGHDVYHIVFRPRDKHDYSWKGDAYVDESTFEPVLVTTGMSRKIPFAVRTFLGINLPGLGFTIVYAPQPDGVWFPSTFSTEFKVKVLFFFNREILLDAQNRDFEKTHAESKILEGVTPIEKP